jgi:hypothetical protein
MEKEMNNQQGRGDNSVVGGKNVPDKGLGGQLDNVSEYGSFSSKDLERGYADGKCITSDCCSDGKKGC